MLLFENGTSCVVRTRHTRAASRIAHARHDAFRVFGCVVLQVAQGVV